MALKHTVNEAKYSVVYALNNEIQFASGFRKINLDLFSVVLAK